MCFIEDEMSQDAHVTQDEGKTDSKPAPTLPGPPPLHAAARTRKEQNNRRSPQQT